MHRKLSSLAFVALTCAGLSPSILSCARDDKDTDSVESAAPEPEQPLVLDVGDAAPEGSRLATSEVWYGDYDDMVERRLIRALVTFSLTDYFLDGPVQRGTSYELLKTFEEAINQELDTGHLKVHVVIVPVARHELLPALVGGRGDIAVANLTVTPERRERVDFSDPLLTDVSEIFVTGPAAPPLQTLDDLAGQEIHVRRSSSYFDSLLRLNDALADAGKDHLVLVETSEYLEDEDLLQMVSAGLLPMIVVDNHKAEFWAQIFENITLRSDLPVASGGDIAWAFRKESPGLAAMVNAFIRQNKKGTLMGNLLFKRYLQNTKWAENALSESGLVRFEEMIGLFQEYADEYELDWLMLAALGYQESRLDQSAVSGAGAIGVMQLLPSTAADRNVGIPDIRLLENNIHAGAKYLRFLQDRYFQSEEIDALDQTFFTLAAYNAGPARVRGLRRRAEAIGLDPNIWFRNVEVVAAREIGRETVDYVSNIFKYYIAYKAAPTPR